MILPRTRCGRCGEVELEGPAFFLFTDPDSQRVSYRFECPYCGTMQNHNASPRTAALLVTLGAATTATPITEGEIQAFLSHLDGDWQRQLGLS